MTATTLDTVPTREREAPRPGRGLGVALSICGALVTILAIAHPDGGGGPDFASVLRAEASGQVPDAIVHGGFVAVLVAELICYAALAVRVGARRTPVLAALVLSAAGVAALSLSMICDGLVIPAIAMKYAGAPETAMAGARAIFVLAGTLIRFLMPIGLALLGAGTLAWGFGFRGVDRPTHMAGLGVGALTLAALAATITEMTPLALMGAIGAHSLWLTVLGARLALKRQAVV